MTFDTLLIPTDGSDPAEATAQWGFDLAAQLEASVHVLSVADSAIATGTGYAGDSATVRARLREQADTRATSLRAQAKERGLDATAVVREGIPAKEIVDYADEQNLDAIAMGTSGRGGVARAVVGSVTDKVVRTAAVPVLTINQTAIDDREESVESILLPTDGSSPAEAAAAYGLDFADRLNATIHILSVADQDVASGLDSVLERDLGSVEDLLEQAGEHGGRIGMRVNERGLEFVVATTDGDPATEIVNYAGENDLDLIVMGTHGRSGFRRAIVGSVTDEVIRSSSLPVLTIRSERGD